MGRINGCIRSAAVVMATALFFGAFAAPCDDTDSASGKKSDCVKYTNAKKSTPPAAVVQKTASPKKELLFFMNPYGRPCQIQDEILQQKMKDISPFATVRYIKTSEGADRNLFGLYGIRGLPSLILLDDKGKEIHRFSPGVQDGDAIAQVLRK